MYKKYIPLAFLILAVFALMRWGFLRGNEAPRENTEKLQVAASFYPLYFFAQEIGGDRAEVFTVTPAGAEPHEYEPTAWDISRIYGSDFLVVNGNGLEPWLQNIQKNLSAGKTKIIIVGEGLAVRSFSEEEVIDPHVWLSPRLASEMAEKIKEEFIAQNPEHVAVYEANAEILNGKLGALDEEYSTKLSECSQKSIVTAHAAFGYLAVEYGLAQVAVTGISPDIEPSQQELAKIVDFARQYDIRYIFFETLVSPKLAEVLAREVGAKTLVLNPLEGLTLEEIRAGKDYFTEMKTNLNNLKIALECK
jgi:zinc transport system substrate-binding protein